MKIKKAAEGKDASLILELMSVSAAETNTITQHVLDAQQHEIDVLRATLAAIRDQVSSLCNRPWAPNPTYIENALYPNQTTISAYLKDGSKDE